MSISKIRTSWLATVFLILSAGITAEEDRYAFIVTGDCQYQAEKSASPKNLDPNAEIANSRFIK